MIIAASGSEVNPTDLPGCDRVGYRVLDHRDGHPFPGRRSAAAGRARRSAAMRRYSRRSWRGQGRLAGAAVRLAASRDHV